MATTAIDHLVLDTAHEKQHSDDARAGSVESSMASRNDVEACDQQDEEQAQPDPLVPVPGSNVAEKISFITSHKLAGNKPVYVTTGGNLNGPGAIVRPATASSSASSASQAKWVQPSGPRLPGQGTENEEQGIIAADPQPEDGVVMRITLLAAGFIIGPAGATVREIMRVTGCDIKSWTDNTGKSGKTAATRRPCRVFICEGEDSTVSAAIDIITAAVDRYKELCEGRCQGQSVNRVQNVMGVEFTYQPPPRNVVPFAASLKGNVAKPAEKPGGAGNRYNSMMQMLPGYIVPMAGSFMPPGSPGSVPFPMYMPHMAAYGLGGEGDSETAADMYNSAVSGTDQVHGSSAADDTSAAGAAPWAALGSPYTYPPGVDPAAMMAYMSIVMPTSPSGAKYPGDPSAFTMPYGMPTSPMTTLTAAMPPLPSFGMPSLTTTDSNRSSTSPATGHNNTNNNPYLVATNSIGSESTFPAASKYGEPAGGGGGGKRPSMGSPHEGFTNPYLDPNSGIPAGSVLAAPVALGMTPVTPGYMHTGYPMGCWYPPSPAAVAGPPLQMPAGGGGGPSMASQTAMAYNSRPGGGGGGGRRGPGAAGSPRDLNNHHLSGPGSRLNPSAPTYTPWGSARTTADSDSDNPANSTHNHAGYISSRQDVRSNSYAGMEYSGGYCGNAIGYGKTPKRPSAMTTGGGGGSSSSSGPGMYYANRPGFRSAGGGFSAKVEGVISPEQAGHLSVSPPTSQGARGPASTGAGSGSGYVQDTATLVSSDDPLISPTRFGKRDRNSGRRDDARDGGPAMVTQPPPPPLPSLPTLVEKMTL